MFLYENYLTILNSYLNPNSTSRLRLLKWLDLDFVITRMNANLFIAWLDINLIEHVLPSQGFGDTFSFVFREWMLGIDTRYFKHAVVKHHHAQRAQGHARRHLNVIHVVNLEVTCLLDPVLDKRIPQGMLSFAFGQIGAFDDQAKLAAFVIGHCQERSWSQQRACGPRFSGKKRFAVLLAVMAEADDEQWLPAWFCEAYSTTAVRLSARVFHQESSIDFSL